MLLLVKPSGARASEIECPPADALLPGYSLRLNNYFRTTKANADKIKTYNFQIDERNYARAERSEQGGTVEIFADSLENYYHLLNLCFQVIDMEIIKVSRPNLPFSEKFHLPTLKSAWVRIMWLVSWVFTGQAPIEA